MEFRLSYLVEVHADTGLPVLAEVCISKKSQSVDRFVFAERYKKYFQVSLTLVEDLIVVLLYNRTNQLASCPSYTHIHTKEQYRQRKNPPDGQYSQNLSIKGEFESRTIVTEWNQIRETVVVVVVGGCWSYLETPAKKVSFQYWAEPFLVCLSAQSRLA